VARGHHALPIQQGAELATQHVAQRETQVVHPGDGFGILRGALQPPHQRQRAACAPQAAVAAHMLQVQTGVALGSEVAAQVAVAAARTANAVREHHQRHGPGCRCLCWQVQAHGHGALPRGVRPVQIEGADAAFLACFQP
jgi:hypothetical protein